MRWNLGQAFIKILQDQEQTSSSTPTFRIRHKTSNCEHLSEIFQWSGNRSRVSGALCRSQEEQRPQMFSDKFVSVVSVPSVELCDGPASLHLQEVLHAGLWSGTSVHQHHRGGPTGKNYTHSVHADRSVDGLWSAWETSKQKKKSLYFIFTKAKRRTDVKHMNKQGTQHELGGFCVNSLWFKGSWQNIMNVKRFRLHLSPVLCLFVFWSMKLVKLSLCFYKLKMN